MLIRYLLQGKLGSDVEVDGVRGTITTLIVEPFLPHPQVGNRLQVELQTSLFDDGRRLQKDEYYVCIASRREGEDILFTHEVRVWVTCRYLQGVWIY